MSHDAIARKSAGATLETLVSRILRTFDRATSSDIEAGASWYSEAQSIAVELAPHAGSLEHAAVALAHLSPRTSWARNVSGAYAILQHADTSANPAGCLGDNVARARKSLNYSDPLQSFSPNAPKTRRFALNILGDTEAVTVDVWAARVAGVTELQLARKGVYDAIEHAYRLAARRRGVTPATMQATTWVVARGGRSA